MCKLTVSRGLVLGSSLLTLATPNSFAIGTSSTPPSNRIQHTELSSRPPASPLDTCACVFNKYLLTTRPIYRAQGGCWIGGARVLEHTIGRGRKRACIARCFTWTRERRSPGQFTQATDSLCGTCTRHLLQGGDIPEVRQRRSMRRHGQRGGDTLFGLDRASDLLTGYCCRG